MIRFEEALTRYRKRRLTAEEAGEVLGMSGRHFRRLIDRYDEDGVDGLRDRRLGKPSPRRAPAKELTRMQILYQERYRDFTVKHFHEQLQKRHGYTLGYTVTRLSLQAAGLVAKAKKRGPHRQRRERRPLPGMLLFQDGSTHAWIAGQPELDLVVTMDDATSTLYSMLFVAEEGTASSFLGLLETIAQKGLFSAFYTDRGSHYFHTPKAGGPVDKARLTQVGRALQQLGITHIPSYSPEARGRMERVFGTLQNRLPQELRVAKIATIEAANRYLKERFMADFNARFAVAAAEPGSAFVAYAGRP
ncbi:MAG: ISNCY family transposase, partial [Stellaceae bacterium]